MTDPSDGTIHLVRPAITGALPPLPALAALTLVLAACSVLGPEEPEGEQPTPAEAVPTGSGAGGQDEQDAAFGEACTGTGSHVVDSSVERPVEGAPEIDGERLRVALGHTSSEGPSARLYLASAGSSPTQVDGGVVAAAVHGPWQLEITSICAGEVRFEVEESSPSWACAEGSGRRPARRGTMGP